MKSVNIIKETFDEMQAEMLTKNCKGKKADPGFLDPLDPFGS